MPSTLTSWRDDPRAQQLLAVCATDYPRTHEFRYDHGETDVRYAGSIVTKLNGIYKRYAEQLFAEGERTGDRSAWEAHNDDSVSQAIADSIVSAQAQRRAA